MLKERVFTALVLVAVVLGVMLGLPPIATVWLLTVLVLVGAWEWAGFAGFASPVSRAMFTIVVALALIACLYLYTASPGFVWITLTIAMLWWFAAFLWICLAPARVTKVTAALAGLLSLVPCWLALVYVTFTTQSGLTLDIDFEDPASGAGIDRDQRAERSGGARGFDIQHLVTQKVRRCRLLLQLFQRPRHFRLQGVEDDGTLRSLGKSGGER